MRTAPAGAGLRDALDALYGSWLAERFAEASARTEGLALVAVGGLGRGEPAPGSDLDLVLLHDGVGGVAAVADALWYPIWDSGIGLDHSVRTVAEAISVAATDLKAALGLLDARHVAGDGALTATLLAELRGRWRAAAPRRLPELREAVQDRARRFGEVAFLLEPNLKEARGGLRDVHALHAVAVAQVADVPVGVAAAYRVLLDVRGELGRRASDVLLMQEQDAVAAAVGATGAEELMAQVSAAARTISYAGDTVWRRVPRLLPERRGRLLGRRGAPAPGRRPLARDVLEHAGEVVLARDADPPSDAELVLRVAEAAARADLPIAPHALDRLAAEAPPLPQPWPDSARELLVGLLAAGPPAVAVFEALDQHGLLVQLVPEWAQVRSKPQRNSYHRFTVDRHLVEAAAAAAALTRRVARPDLLLLGALLHDIGKGWPGDHTEQGVVVVGGIAPRLGLPPDDVAVLVAMVRHHLLLPDLATRRDLADPATAEAVAAAAGSTEVLELLHALTEADSAATGPAAWSGWKAQLVEELVLRAQRLLQGRPAPPPPALTARQEELVAAGRLALDADGEVVTVVAPDRPGLLTVSSGVLALHRLDVRSASAFSRGTTAVSVFRVSPRFGRLPDWAVVRDDLRRALDGGLDLAPKLAEREAAYPPGRAPVAPATVRLLDDASATATVVEVRAPDRLGVLHRITEALAACGLDVRTAHISTLGADVVDAFYVVGRDGGKLTAPAERERAVAAVLEAVAAA